MKKVLGYLDRWSVAPGDRIEVKVGTYGPTQYDAALVRAICGDDRPNGPGFKEEEIAMPFTGRHDGRFQPLHAGSYGIVDAAGNAGEGRALSVQAMVWPTTPAKGRQGIVTRWDEKSGAGFALFIDGNGAPAFAIGNGKGRRIEVSSHCRLPTRTWSFVAASFDGAAGVVRIYQASRAAWSRPDVIVSEHWIDIGAIGLADAPLLVAAFPGDGAPTAQHYNGKIDRVRISRRCLNETELLSQDAELPQSLFADLVAAWDFSLGMADERMIDRSGNRLDGCFINLPSRGVTGAGWSGREYSWQNAPDEYSAVHFHDDDIYDAGWQTDFSFTVPDSWRSGIYAIRLESDGDWHYLPFFVRPPRGTATQRLALLASTATYMAYANYQWALQEPLAELKNAALMTFDPADIFLQEHPEAGLSTYDKHTDGSGSRYASRLRPVLNINMKSSIWSFNADLHLTDWLEAIGIEYDVITDDDLHYEGVSLLENYDAVLTGGHPEYWSTPMWNSMKSYLGRGGRLLYLGGNGFYWRCAYHPSLPGVVEVRRTEDGARYWAEEPGESFLHFTGEYGGLWRRIGEAPQTLVGIGTVATGFDASSYYRRRPESFDPRVAFMFAGIGRDELIGDFGSLLGGAAGFELDAVDAHLGTPPHALVVARSEEHSPGMMLSPDATDFHHTMLDGAQNPEVCADLVFFETPNGGAVFSTGSITWIGSFAHNGYDNNVSRLTANVIKRFLDPTPFPMPDHAIPGRKPDR